MLNKANDYLKEIEEEMINFWRDLVNHEAGSYEPENLLKAAGFLKSTFEKEGLTCKFVEVGENAPPMLVGIIGEERQGKPILLTGHYDTVFESGTFGENPFIIKGNKAFGPGVLDMKGGIAIALYVIKTLNKINYSDTPVKIVFVGDEESLREGNNTEKLLKNEVKDCLFAFNLETAREDNKLCIGRKGCAQYEITVEGVSSHPGNNFESGRNAIEEMAHKIIELQALTTDPSAYSVSVTLINGGRAANVIPDKCVIIIDVRYTSNEALNDIENKIKEICFKTYVKDTSTKFKRLPVLPPFETTEKVKEFYAFVSKVSEEIGLGIPGSIVLGGASDASHIAETGIPVICSFGVKGNGNHSVDEYALVDSLMERAYFITAVILKGGKEYESK